VFARIYGMLKREEGGSDAPRSQSILHIDAFNVCFWADEVVNLGHFESGSYGECGIEVFGQAAISDLRMRYSFASTSRAAKCADG
jgi:hypothetical protein